MYALILGEGQTSRGEHREDISADVVKELHQNTLESAEKVGYKEVYFADFPDNRFDQVDLLDVVKAVEHKIKEIQPEIIYTHYSGDLNIDHQYTARAVLTATRPIGDYPVKEIYAFETLSSTEWNFDYSSQPAFCPNVYVDITQFYANKEAAMKCYVSELCEVSSSKVSGGNGCAVKDTRNSRRNEQSRGIYADSKHEVIKGTNYTFTGIKWVKGYVYYTGGWEYGDWNGACHEVSVHSGCYEG